MNKPELKQTYLDQVVPALLKSQGYKNIHQVPKIEKVVLNSSFGVELDKNGIEELRKDIMSLAGQAPVVVRAKMLRTFFEGLSNASVWSDLPQKMANVSIQEWDAEPFVQLRQSDA